MTPLGWAEVVAGVAIVLATFYDLFHSVVLPRPSINRFVLVRFLFRGLWGLWRWIGGRIRTPATRESWLAVFGPAGVILIFVLWAVAFLLGYALVLDGFRSQIRPPLAGIGDSLYFSATTIVPLSYGDFVPEGWAPRLTIIFESATGVGIAALVITLLFSLYQSFQEREELVVTLDALAGAPPSGLQILERAAADRGLRPELVKTFDDWRKWSAAVLESHLAYPILVYFRSSHDNEAWLNSFGAVMDAATLTYTTLDEDEVGSAKLMLTVGDHLVEDLAWYLRYARSTDPHVDREEFDEAYARLKAAGFKCRPVEQAWSDFSRFRAKYAAQLSQMAHFLAIPEAEWIGDRSYVPHADGRGGHVQRRKKTPV